MAASPQPDIFAKAHADAQKAVATFLPSLVGRQDPPPQPPGPPKFTNMKGPQEALRVLSLASKAESMSRRVARGMPPEDPPPTPEQQFGNNLDIVHTRAIASAIASHPEEERARLISEAHDSATKWVGAHNGKVIVHGKVEIATSPESAERLAAKIVNGTVEDHDQRQLLAMSASGAVDKSPTTLGDSSMVKGNVRVPGRDGKVGVPVVGADSVDMVNDLGGQQGPAQPSLNDQSVLENAAPVNAEGDIPAVQESSPSANLPTAVGAVSPSTPSNLTGNGVEGAGADFAGSGGPVPLDRSSGSGTSLSGRSTGTSTGTELGVASIPGRSKLNATELADEGSHSKQYSTMGSQQRDSEPEIVLPGDGAEPPKGKTPTISAPEAAKVGETNEDGDLIMQPKNSVEQNQKLAIKSFPELLNTLSVVVDAVPGATFDRIRPQKSEDRLDDKTEEKAPEALSDYLGAQVSADSPQAKDALLASLKRQFDVIEVDDQFMEGRQDKAGYPSANVQIRLPDSNTAEIQIVPAEVQDRTEESHKFYKAGREAEVNGDNKERDKQWAQAAKIHGEALDAFKQRNGINVQEADSVSGSGGGSMLHGRAGTGSANENGNSKTGVPDPINPGQLPSSGKPIVRGLSEFEAVGKPIKIGNRMFVAISPKESA